MTGSNIPKMMFIPQAFASGTGAARETIGSTSSNNINFVDGFPSAYSASNPNGGKFVTRAEMNAIGYLASANAYAKACGGINTFSPDLAVVIGGYGYGAVLEIVEGNEYHKVISLIDNNKVDFNKDTLTASQIAAGITLGEVDGVNWAYCANGTIEDGEVVGNLPNFNWLGSNLVEINTISSFIAKRNGIITFEGSFSTSEAVKDTVSSTKTTTAKSGEEDSHQSVETTTVERQYSGVDQMPALVYPRGCMILCCESPNNPFTSLANIIYSRAYAAITVGSHTYLPENQTVMSVTKGTRYALYFLNQNTTITNSTFKIKVVS